VPLDGKKCIFIMSLKVSPSLFFIGVARVNNNGAVCFWLGYFFSSSFLSPLLKIAD
jgi:hypothetical protein